ncbi:MAG: aminoacyl--tRNA ligase-related protein [Patescibacteria group bacterium]
MRLTKLFTKTRKETPTGETAKNAELLLRAGFIFKEMAGVYSFLPLGLRVLKKIEGIIRDEMDKAGGLEMQTSVLQSKEVWEQSGRWSDEVVDNWFKSKLKTGGEVGLSFTNEEAYSNILKQYISSYKDLPVYPYDFKHIFRNEVRSKSGILRGREFYWKALYSFSRTDAEHAEFYERMKSSYQAIFRRVGIGHLTYMTFASGGSFSKFSHEFQAITSAGEDTIYLDEKLGIAINKEVYTDEVIDELKLDKNSLVEKKSIEVGNIFSLGTKFSVPFDLTYQDEGGQKQPVIMGSYGIGLGRLMGTVVEILSDENGMVWPRSIAPFTCHLIALGEKLAQADVLYEKLVQSGVEVLYDDRADKTAGEKFADADLIGCPVRITIGGKTPDGQVEFKPRSEKESQLVDEAELLELTQE